MLSTAPTLGRASARRGWGTLALGALVSVVALWLLYRSVNLEEVGAALVSSQPLWIVLALAAQLVAMLVSVLRWQVLLRPYPTRLWNLVSIYFVGHLLNTLLPAKLGSVSRVLLAAESEQLNLGLVLGSVAIEKALDSLVMLVLLALLVPFVPMPDWLRGSLLGSLVTGLVALAVLASVGRFRETLIAALARLETRLRGRTSERAAALARGLLESIAALTQRRDALVVPAWTGVIWLLGGLVNQLLFAAVGIEVPWSATWFVIVALQIGTRVPALPANLGVFHYVVVLALGVYGVSATAALAYAILLHLVVFILPAVLGAGFAIPVSARLARLVADWHRA